MHIHSSTAKVVVPRQLPGTVRHFVNRTVEQDALTTLLNGAGSTVLVSTVDGLGGVGKSTLVVQWAHQVRERFPDGDLYVNLRGFDPAADPMSPSEALNAFLYALGVSQEAMPATEDSKAAQFRTLVHGKRMLVVLDNARDAEQVRSLLPGSPGVLVVVTSRQRLDGLIAHHGAQRLALATLTSDEGFELLTSYLGENRLAAERESVAELLEHCAGLPLALTLVAVLALTEPDTPLAELAQDLRGERDRLDALDAGGRTGIRAVFSWSYRSLSTQAARMFRLLGLPTSPDISLDAVAALTGVRKSIARRQLAELTSAHLLTRRAGDRYVFHDLLRAYARECAQADETEQARTEAVGRLLAHYVVSTGSASKRVAPNLPVPELDGLEGAAWPDFATREDALAWWDAEHGNVLATIQQASAQGMPHGPWLAHIASLLFKLRGLLEEWTASCTSGIAGARHIGDDVVRARLLLNLGSAYHFRRELDLSVESLTTAAQSFAELGDAHWEAVARQTLAEAFLEAHDYADAASNAQCVLEVLGSSGDAELRQLAHTVLGSALAHKGDYEQALTNLNRAVEINGDEFARGFTLNELASANLLAGQMMDAVRTYRDAVAHRRGLGQRIGEAESLNGLGTALRASGNLDEARESWQQALAIFEELDHPDAETVRSHLASLDAQA